MPLYFSEILAEALFSEVVPLDHFRRVVYSREDAIIFFRNYHRSAVFRFCDNKSFSQSDGSEQTCIFPRRDIRNGRQHWRPWKLFLGEDVAVDPAYERTAVEHLVEDGHREVHAPGLDEGAEAFVFLEEDGGDEAHNRAHHGADAEGDGVGDEGRAVIRAHDLEGQDVGDATDHEELEDEGDRNHDQHLMESGEETHRGHAAGIEGDVIDDHPINHDEGHDGSEYNILKLGFRHKKSSCDETSVVRYHPGGVCVAN